MEQKLYNRLLFRLLAMPVASLALLALILGYALNRVQQSARAVDHSDQVMAHANYLTRLMVDEETGLRGYLLTQDPAFLQPFREADRRLEPELNTLYDLVRASPGQTARLNLIRATHARWETDARQEIVSVAAASNFTPNLRERKLRMDELRAEIDDFIGSEEHLRLGRSETANHIGRLSLLALIALAILAALAIGWATRKLFGQLTLAYNRQIAEARRRGEESYAREQWLNTTLRSIGDAVIACDSEGKVEFMNRVAEQLTGWPEADAKGLPLHRIFPIFNEETRAPVENPVDKVRRLGVIVGLANHTFLIARDGGELPIDDSGAPIRDSDGRMIGIVLIFRDIGERRLAEKALMRAEKLAAVGRMAASVAHEVNNPLEGLTNLVYIARRSPDPEEVRQSLDQAEVELGRIAHITRQSLGFYREALTPAHFRPAAVVRDVAEFYSSRARGLGIKIQVDAEARVEVLGKAGELRQVLSNLLANALDACPPGAIIRMRARAAVDARDTSSRGVRITVCDSGPGIQPHHLAHIFEPFFTTKKDTGTGLGLWVCRELIEKHGGTLRVRSSTAAVRCGAVFSLFLPVIGKSSNEASLEEVGVS